MRQKIVALNYPQLAEKVLNMATPITLEYLQEHHAYLLELVSEDNLIQFIEDINLVGTKIIQSRYNHMSEQFSVKQLMHLFKPQNEQSNNDINVIVIQEILKLMSRPILFDNHFTNHNERREWQTKNCEKSLLPFVIYTKTGINNFSAGLILCLTYIAKANIKEYFRININKVEQSIFIKVRELGLEPSIIQKIATLLEIEDLMYKLFSEWSETDG